VLVLHCKATEVTTFNTLFMHVVVGDKGTAKRVFSFWRHRPCLKVEMHMG